MHLLCPHCHNPIELADLASGRELVCPSCGSSFQLERGSTTTDWQPRKLGKFDLLEEVGIGAFGTVYKARDPELDRVVAIKVPRAGNLPSSADLDRFLREARSVAQLRHHGIVPIHEVGQQETVPYLVSDFVQGITLADQLAVRRPGFREAAELIAAVADALQYAHEQGVVHRDVKPSNIMLSGGPDTRGGPDTPVGQYEPHLMDFGLAKREAGEITMTMEGQVLGTPAYMSPEQARGEAHKVDGRSDVYSLGVILYRMLTGELPFRGNTRMLLHQVLHDEPRSPRSLNDHIPRDLETICLKAMAKEPERRYATARALADDLRRFLRREPIQARPVGRLERLVRWCRRNPGVASLLGAVALSLLAGTTVSLYFAIKAEDRARDAFEQKELADNNAKKAQDQAAEADKNAKRADANAAEAQANLYLAHMNLAQAAWENAHVGQVLDLLEVFRHPAPGQKDLRGWEWYYQERLCHDDLRTLKGHTGPVSSVAFSPDGQRLVSASGDRTVKVWDTASSQVLRTLKGHTDWVLGVAFSPDSQRLASAGWDRTVKIWDIDPKRAGGVNPLIRTLRGHTAEVESVGFSPDGQRLASASGDRTVKVWDAASGQVLRTLKGHTAQVFSVAFSPDGRRLASASLDGTVQVWDAASGQVLRTLKGHGGAVDSVAFSPDGQRLASAGWDRTVRVWNAASGGELRTLTGHTDLVLRVAFSPDGQRLASASRDGTVKVWDAVSRQEPRTLKGHTNWVRSVAFSPDGERLASASQDGTVKFWDAASGQEVRTLTGHSSRVDSVAFSPNGQRVASASGDGTVKFWDAGSGQELRTLKGHTGAVWSVAFSADGQRLASASGDGTVKVWDTAGGQVLRTLKGHADWVLGVAFSADGQRLASVSEDGTVKVWDAASGQVLRTLSGNTSAFWLLLPGTHKDHTSAVWSVAFSPDGRLLASASHDRTVKVWDVASGQVLRTLKGHTDWVSSVAFSPDGRLLASASHDRTVKVWDIDSRRAGGANPLIHTLTGHTNGVSSVAFCPDGQRLASASYDGTVKVWDAASGRELRTLKGHTGLVLSVAFSPDGQRLASAGTDGTVRVWDARPLTPEVETEREALGLLEFFCPRSQSKADLVERVCGNKMISDAVRQKTLTLLEPYWDNYLHGEAQTLVQQLFAKPLLRPDVLESIRADAKLREPVRREALILAKQHPEDALRLNNASWEVVRKRGAKAAAYRAALRQAEAASQLERENGLYLNTLGVAQYRLGKYKEALEILTRSDKINSGSPQGTQPADIAFLSMAQYQLGQKEKAQASLTRLREILKQPKFAKDQEAQGFLREAETLLKEQPIKPKK